MIIPCSLVPAKPKSYTHEKPAQSRDDGADAKSDGLLSTRLNPAGQSGRPQPTGSRWTRT